MIETESEESAVRLYIKRSNECGCICLSINRESLYNAIISLSRLQMVIDHATGLKKNRNVLVHSCVWESSSCICAQAFHVC